MILRFKRCSGVSSHILEYKSDQNKTVSFVSTISLMSHQMLSQYPLLRVHTKKFDYNNDNRHIYYFKKIIVGIDNQINRWHSTSWNRLQWSWPLRDKRETSWPHLRTVKDYGLGGITHFCSHHLPYLFAWNCRDLEPIWNLFFVLI